MLQLSEADLLNMPLGDFVLQAESRLLWEEERIEMSRDSTMPFHALYTAFEMQSTGNMKKSFDPLKTAEKLYPSDEVWGSDSQTTSKGDIKGDYSKGKEALESAFELGT